MIDHPPSLAVPEIAELIALRRRRYVWLSAVVSAVYAVVALACAFAPALLAQPAAGTSVSLGIVAMVLVIAVAIVSAGYYTWWSNTVRDPLAARAIESLARRKTG